ncbi:helix-turn-helix transcriptional regulator [Roseateles oligotrophus]|uniref:WYL domain-containing protein n=1 Tax=Roseateles oligotrophus TaxID=1769250 RepID=A0ABT2YJL7_9BURK|nr:WYL domain-containing transcriptional regulator [Roseateles oligotrophus]MCV2370228.1 WYL domain-containing protein [Roseateles oligotrophus]
MAKASPKGIKLAVRLVRILKLLFDGHRLTTRQLVAEFSVSKSTILRDLERLSEFGLETEGYAYFLNPNILGAYSSTDAKNIVDNIGGTHLFPDLSLDLLSELARNDPKKTILIKGHHLENINPSGANYSIIRSAIRGRNRISFEYKKKYSSKNYDQVEPYKLVNHKGIWYLAAKHADRPKTFSFGLIQQLLIDDSKSFEHDAKLLEAVNNDDGIWFGAETQRIVIMVDAEAAPYFKRRKLISNQVIEKEFPNGSLQLAVQAVHPNQVIPIVKYWIPHLRIHSPAELQRQLIYEIQDYSEGIVRELP